MITSFPVASQVGGGGVRDTKKIQFTNSLIQRELRWSSLIQPTCRLTNNGEARLRLPQ